MSQQMLLLLFLCGVPQLSMSQEAVCIPITDSQESQLANYVGQKYHLETGARLKVSVLATLDGSCYRKLRFETETGPRHFRVDLIASPDLRFLAPEFFDVRLSPTQEQGRREATLVQDLTDGNVPVLGEKSAPVAITIFSDFQCPFCAEAATGLTKELLPSYGERVRLVFRQYPLPSHSWARQAAEASACAALQGNPFFWRFHDALFNHQADITVSQFRAWANDAVGEWKGFDQTTFDACIDQRASGPEVDKDLALGRDIGVSATPTIFVNGKKLIGFQIEELRTLIEQTVQSLSKGELTSSPRTPRP